MQKETEVKPMIPARNGIVRYCMYCGEDAVTGALCKTCRSKKGREEIYNQNLEVLKELRLKGYCQEQVFLIKP